MFFVAEFRDTVVIHPQDFSKTKQECIIRALNTKYANKVVHKVGLCIALWGLTKIGDSFLFCGDGSSHTKVEFQFVVFRPFSDEILEGKIRSSSAEGLCITMGFFDDILIPADSVPSPSRFNEAEQLWIWEYKSETGEQHDLPIELGAYVRFKMTEEIFTDTTPQKPGDKVIQITEKKIPYQIIGTMNECGLGPLSWWNGGA